MYKTITSIEKQLQNIANNNSDYQELWSIWNLNKKTLEPVLSAIIKDYPHYSLHDHSHSESILLNIERFLGNENIDKLSPTDLWLLLHLAYLHDFGMVILDSKIHDFWQTKEFQSFLKEKSESYDDDVKKAAITILEFNKVNENYSVSWPLDIKEAVTLLISSYCRWQHADFSKDYILDINHIWGIDLGHNGLIKKRLISLLADISAIHTKPFDAVLKLHKETNGFKNDYVHPRLIACLLRLGDVLDLDNGRFNQYGEKIFGKMPNDSKTHFEKHEATKHVLITDELIEVESDCPTDDTYRETRKWYDSLKSEMDNLHLNWNDIAPKEFNYPPKLLPYKILRNGVVDTYELSNLKFAISQSKAFEILEGSSIYKDKFSCIREIVQNAEDATKIQLWRDIKSGMYYSENGIDRSKVESGNIFPWDIPMWIYKIYSIEVTVEKNEKNNAVISVTDRGTGITLETLKTICNVGQSYFQKKKSKNEIEQMPMWLRPTANFGVGLQSCFMVTDKITIKTNSNEDNSYKLTFKSGKEEGYVNVESLKGSVSRGSCVILELSNDLSFSYDVFGFTAENLMRIEPFKTNCIIIYKAIESIFKECNSSFFDINVISKSLDCENKISSNILEKIIPNELILIDDLFLLKSEDERTITCWYNNNFYKITFDKYSYGKVNVNFKGKRVDKTEIFMYDYIGFIIEVDIYGIATKDALSLNREQLNSYASSKVCEELNHIIKVYIDQLTKEVSSIQSNTELVDALMLTSWLYKKRFPKQLYNYLSDQKNIRVLNFDESENTYKAGYCSLRDIASKYPRLPYVNCEIGNNKMLGVQEFTEKELVEILNNSNIDKTKNNQLIIDDKLKEFLSHCYYETTYLKCKENLEICVAVIDDELLEPDDYTRKQMIKKLVCDESCKVLYNTRNIMRCAIPAFNDYPNLAVTINNIPFISKSDSVKWYIISPISLNDYAKSRELSKDAFMEYIINQITFNNVVDYVFEHGKYHCNKENIINDYKRLINEYYDTLDHNKTSMISQ